MEYLANPWFLAAAGLGAFVAGLSKGGFGATGGMVAAPMAALAAPAEVALAVMLPVLWLMDWVGLRAYWGAWDRRHALGLLAAAAVGVGVGALILPFAPDAAIRAAIGAIALGFLALRAIQGPKPSAPMGLTPTQSTAILGSAAGLTSMVAHAGGPLVTMRLLPLGLDRRTHQATTVLFFWGVNTLKFAPFLGLGLIDWNTAAASAGLAPIGAAGVLLGVWANARISDRLYYRFIIGLLAVVGVKLLWDGVVGLLA